MKRQNLLIGLIIFLVMTNIATVFTVIHHIRKPAQPSIQSNTVSDTVNLPDQQRVLFFTEQLGLTPDQQDEFREISMKYNQEAKAVSAEMSKLRIQQLEVMDKSQPDMNLLTDLSQEIGAKHTELKNMTINYYLGLKRICTGEQQQKLYEIFKKILNPDGEVDLPRGGPRGRGNRRGGPPANRGPWWQKTDTQ